jgi:ABC-type glycerol-3-phosphate transport system substrate-binding protein
VDDSPTRKTGGEELYGLTMPGSGNPAVDIFHMNLFKAGLPGVFDEKGDLYWGKNHPENKEAVLRVAQYLYNLANGAKVTPPGIAAMGTTENLKFYLDGKAAMLFDLIHKNDQYL